MFQNGSRKADGKADGRTDGQRKSEERRCQWRSAGSVRFARSRSSVAGRIGSTRGAGQVSRKVRLCVVALRARRQALRHSIDGPGAEGAASHRLAVGLLRERRPRGAGLPKRTARGLRLRKIGATRHHEALGRTCSTCEDPCLLLRPSLQDPSFLHGTRRKALSPRGN